MRFVPERQVILDTCLCMQSIGFFIGTWGNISMRAGDLILLTPSRVSYDKMAVEDIVLIDLDGNIVEGNRTPTSEKEVHRKIYAAREDVHAIIHTHTSGCMAASTLKQKSVPCLTEEMSQLLGGAIPISEMYVPAEKHEELGKTAAHTLGKKSGCILKNHGAVACGRDMEEAVLVSKVLEKSCEIFLNVMHCPHDVIPEAAVLSERFRYLYKYGNEK